MKSEHGTITGNLTLDSNLILYGMVTGSVVVNKGGTLYLHGSCLQNLTINKGGCVYLFGTVSGNVDNLGGYLEIYGRIDGFLRTETGKTTIDNKAFLRSKSNC